MPTEILNIQTYTYWKSLIIEPDKLLLCSSNQPLTLSNRVTSLKLVIFFSHWARSIYHVIKFQGADLI